MDARKFLKTLLRGVSQVMLQDNVATGVLFLAGIFINSWLMGVGAILGVLTSTTAAILFRYEQKDIETGIYGFNGTLVGVAVFFFYGFSAVAVIAIIVGAVFSSIITYWMKKVKVPPYTAPFVISTWVLFFILGRIGVHSQAHPLVETNNLDWLVALGKGFGQVMFQNNALTGAIFLLAIAISSGLAALFASSGAILGVLLPYLISFPLDATNIGIFGFNAVLCGIAFVHGKKPSSFAYGLLAIITSIFITYLMLKLNMTTLTAPFVLATWWVLAMKEKIVNKVQKI